MSFDPTTNPDVQEALSRRYSDDIIMLLPLTSGRIAIWNSARELCGFIETFQLSFASDFGPGVLWDWIRSVWHPPAAAPTLTKPPVDLEELELI